MALRQNQGLLGMYQAGQLADANFAMDQSRLALSREELEQRKATQLFNQALQAEQLAVSQGNLAIREKELDLNKANFTLNQNRDKREEEVEKRAAYEFNFENNRRNYNDAMTDLREKIENQIEYHKNEGGGVATQHIENLRGMLKEITRMDSSGRYGKRMPDVVRAALYIYGEEGIGDWLDLLGGSNLLEDYTRKGERVGDKKSFSSLAFNPSTGMATARVKTERGEHPLTIGGENFADGGQMYSEDGQFPIADLNNAINLLHAQYGSDEAQVTMRLLGDRGVDSSDTSILDLFTNGKLDLTKLTRTEKEDLLSRDITEKMSNDLATELYGELMVDPDSERRGDNEFVITPSGITAVDGYDLTDRDAERLIKASFGGRFKRQGPYSTSLRSASLIVKENPNVYQNYVHNANKPFGLTAENQKDFSQNQIDLWTKQSALLGEASALRSLDDLVYTGTKESRMGPAGRPDRTLTDIGQMMAGLDSGDYKENDRINGERYSKEQAEAVKKFYEGNREALGKKLGTDVTYRQEFLDLGPMKFALRHTGNESLFKIVDPKTKTKSKVNVAQMKNYLKNEHNITVPSGQVTVKDLETFREAVRAADIPEEKIEQWDSTIANVIQLAKDDYTKELDIVGFEDSIGYRAFTAMSAFAMLPENQMSDAARTNFLNLATTGKATSQIQTESQYIQNITDLARSQATLQQSQNSVTLENKRAHNGNINEVKEHVNVALQFFSKAMNPRTVNQRSTLKQDRGSANAAMSQMATIGLLTKTRFGTGSEEYQEYATLVDPVFTASLKDWAQNNKENRWLPFLSGIDVLPEVTTQTPRLIVKTVDGEQRLTKLSQLVGDDGRFSTSKVGSIQLVDPAERPEGGKGSFYSYISQYGEEAGKHVLSRFVGLEDDITPRR